MLESYQGYQHGRKGMVASTTRSKPRQRQVTARKMRWTLWIAKATRHVLVCLEPRALGKQVASLPHSGEGPHQENHGARDGVGRKLLLRRAPPLLRCDVWLGAGLQAAMWMSREHLRKLLRLHQLSRFAGALPRGLGQKEEDETFARADGYHRRDR